MIDKLDNKEKESLLKDKYFLLLILIEIVFTIFLLSPSIHGTDGVSNFVYLRSLVVDHNIDFTNEYEYFDNTKDYPFKFKDLGVTQTGKPVNRYGIGSSILWSPFYITVYNIRAILNIFDYKFSLEGYEYPFVLATALGTAFYGSLGLIAIYLLLRLYFTPFLSFIAVLSFWFCSPAIFYMYLHPSMSHIPSFFLISTFYYLLFKRIYQIKPHKYFRLGILFSLAVMTRYQDIIHIIPFIIAIIILIIKLKKENNPKLKKVRYSIIAFIIATILTFIPQMIVWKYLNGSFFSGPTPYLDYGTNLFKPVHFFDVMFSSKNGLFFYHPFLLIAVVGLIIYLKKEWVISIIFLLAFLCTLYLISCWAVWFAGASFGHRMFVSSGIMFAFGFAAFYKHIFRENKFIVIFLFLIFFLWNIGLIVQYSTKMIPHQDYVPFKTIVQNQFKKVPNEFISHIKQFFKNKESFRI